VAHAHPDILKIPPFPPGKITTLITNIFGIGVMLLLTLYLQLNKDKFLGIFFVQYFGKLHLAVLNEFL